MASGQQGGPHHKGRGGAHRKPSPVSHLTPPSGTYLLGLGIMAAGLGAAMMAGEGTAAAAPPGSQTGGTETAPKSEAHNWGPQRSPVQDGRPCGSDRGPHVAAQKRTGDATVNGGAKAGEVKKVSSPARATRPQVDTATWNESVQARSGWPKYGQPQANTGGPPPWRGAKPTSDAPMTWPGQSDPRPAYRPGFPMVPAAAANPVATPVVPVAVPSKGVETPPRTVPAVPPVVTVPTAKPVVTVPVAKPVVDVAAPTPGGAVTVTPVVAQPQSPSASAPVAVTPPTKVIQPVAAPAKAVPTPAVPAAAAAGTTPNLLWQTNFTNIAEMQLSWAMQTGRWGKSSGENQYYTAGQKNASIDASGNLVIAIRQEATPDNLGAPNNYTSARVSTFGKESVEPPVRIVARLKLPSAKGTLPAFWMVGLEPGHEYDWPRQGEVDIVEYPGLGTESAKGLWTGNIHGPSVSNKAVDVKLHGVDANLGVDLSAGFHEYGIDWYPDRITWRVDGVARATVTKTQYEALGGDWTPFSGAWPHYLILNTAVGNPWTGDPNAASGLSQQMLIDWVRVYSL